MKNIEYEGIPDESLIARLRSGETGIEDYLLEKYKRTVRSLARELYLAGGDREDLLQEGMLGLFKAIRDYDPDENASFRTYANLLISRQMYTAVLSAGRQKHRPLNSSISISELQESQKDAELGAADSPENILIDFENARSLREEIDQTLSKMEKEVLDCYLDGMDYHQIAGKMNRTPKSIDNAIQRIRGKVQRIVNRKNG
ncbi:MAG: sigma-70 family RNA polymerase sigma factor [Bilifractor sp.]|nr:sigma-70 family RNA polymerase sigma factor [Lachnospiraceae bacterium]MDY2837467.1 sigma-70 family RNA polymerase sigma factor [Bilifractor sp.]